MTLHCSFACPLGYTVRPAHGGAQGRAQDMVQGSGSGQVWSGGGVGARPADRSRAIFPLVVIRPVSSGVTALS